MILFFQNQFILKQAILLQFLLFFNKNLGSKQLVSVVFIFMQISLDLDEQQSIDVEEIKSILYLTSIAFQLTVDLNLDQKLAKIGHIVEFLAQNPLIKTNLKVKSITQNPVKQYNVAAVGGTFDYLHIGHQILLLYTLLAAKETIYVGVTGEALLINKKYKDLIQPQTLRMKNVRDFLETINGKLELIIFELKDPFGPTISQDRIECLVASPQTSFTIKKINQYRRQNAFKEIELIQCPLMSPNHKIDTKISTTLIKKQLWLKNEFTQQQFKEYKSYFAQMLSLLNQLTKSNQEKRDLADLWWNHIFLSYSQPWRFYHTNRHIYYLFKFWNTHQLQKSKQNLTITQRASLQLALFFHDIVYCPGKLQNERQSANICEKFLRQYLSESPQIQTLIPQAKRLIIETQTHSKPKCLLAQIVYDLDMGILNDPTCYKIYAENVRKEYQPLMGEQFNQKRAQFLVKTLKEGLHFSYEAKHVQKNLNWELQCLLSKQL